MCCSLALEWPRHDPGTCPAACELHRDQGWGRVRARLPVTAHWLDTGLLSPRRPGAACEGSDRWVVVRFAGRILLEIRGSTLGSLSAGGSAARKSFLSWGSCHVPTIFRASPPAVPHPPDTRLTRAHDADEVGPRHKRPQGRVGGRTSSRPDVWQWLGCPPLHVEASAGVAPWQVMVCSGSDSLSV